MVHIKKSLKEKKIGKRLKKALKKIQKWLTSNAKILNIMSH